MFNILINYMLFDVYTLINIHILRTDVSLFVLSSGVLSGNYHVFTFYIHLAYKVYRIVE